MTHATALAERRLPHEVLRSHVVVSWPDVETLCDAFGMETRRKHDADNWRRACGHRLRDMSVIHHWRRITWD